MGCSSGPIFNRDDVSTVELTGKDQAGIYRLAVHQHRTSAAITGAAAFLGAGHADLIAQQIEQQPMSLNLAAQGVAVESELNRRVHKNLSIN
jgi:hypothetical protein